MDWYDGEPNMSVAEAFRIAPKMPNKPERPAWDNNTPVYVNSELGGIYELRSEADRFMHTHSCSGHCFVWNYPNQPYEEGFRLFTYRSHDGWGRVSIQARTMETLIDGSGSRMYSGNWRKLAEERGVRKVGKENLVLIDYDCMYVYGEEITQEQVRAMKEDVLRWWEGLPAVTLPEPTEEELSRKSVYR